MQQKVVKQEMNDGITALLSGKVPTLALSKIIVIANVPILSHLTML